MKKVQILFIHGGMTFKCHEDYLDYLRNRDVSIEKKIKWSGDYLERELGENFEIIHLNMPLKENSKYEEWKIHFEKYVELLDGEGILIGNSLGGIFLAKYLSENLIPKKIISLYLVAPPFDDSLQGEDLVGGFELGSDLSMIKENCEDIKLLFSRDDEVVPVEHAEKYKEKLDNAELTIYEDKNGHFKVEEFPELATMIKENL